MCSNFRLLGCFKCWLILTLHFVQLDSNWDAHLADFGLATEVSGLATSSFANWRSSGKPTGGFHKKNMVGTLLYMAPEILKKELQSEKSDVYGFGITLKYVYHPSLNFTFGSLTTNRFSRYYTIFIPLCSLFLSTHSYFHQCFYRHRHFLINYSSEASIFFIFIDSPSSSSTEAFTDMHDFVVAKTIHLKLQRLLRESVRRSFNEGLFECLDDDTF